jgi:nucleoside-diphosphate-sugar epimerase
MSRILVTGGAGFIGSALVRHLIANTGHDVLNVDALLAHRRLALRGSEDELPDEPDLGLELRVVEGRVLHFSTVRPATAQS